jgi:hypothetical protein
VILFVVLAVIGFTSTTVMCFVLPWLDTRREHADWMRRLDAEHEQLCAVPFPRAHAIDNITNGLP